LAATADSCKDRLTVQFSWSDAKSKCGFAAINSSDSNYKVYQQTITVIRMYKLQDLRQGQSVSRNESSTNVLSIQFPTEVSLQTSSTTQVTGEIEVISAITQISFDPTSEEWSLAVDTSVQAPFTLTQPAISAQSGQILTDNRSITNSVGLATVEGCNNNNADCQQRTSMKFQQGNAAVACDALSGTVSVTYHVACAQGQTSACPLIGNETVTIQVTLSTGSSCPATDNIQFSTLSLSSFADAGATIARTGFITNQLGYFGAIVESSDAQIATKTVKNNSVCFQIGTGACQTVQVSTDYPASGQYDPIFSVDFEAAANAAVFSQLYTGANSAQQYSVKAVILVTFTGATSKRSIGHGKRAADPQELDIFTEIVLAKDQTQDAGVGGSNPTTSQLGDKSDASIQLANSVLFYALLVVLPLFLRN
jgi:hypothetical protein